MVKIKFFNSQETTLQYLYNLWQVGNPEEDFFFTYLDGPNNMVVLQILGKHDGRLFCGVYHGSYCNNLRSYDLNGLDRIKVVRRFFKMSLEEVR